MLFSIHTFQFYSTIQMPELKQLCQRLAPYGQQKLIKNNHFWHFIFSPIFQSSISIRATPVFHWIDNRCLCIHLSIKVNPRRAIGSQHDAAAQIIDASSLCDALIAIYEQLYEILPPEIVDSLTLSRVDLTGDLKFETQRLADEYVKLFQKGRAVRTLSEIKCFDQILKRYVSYEESWLLGCGSYSFQVYPKMTQMQNRNIPAAELAEGVVRFELRAGCSKIKSLIKKHSLPTGLTASETLVLLAQRIPEQEIKSMAKAAVGSGNFYHLKELKTMIENSKYQTRVKKKMVRLADQLSRFSSVERLFEEHLLVKEEWRLLLNRFDAIDASPIPIPARFQFDIAPGVESWDQCFS